MTKIGLMEKLKKNMSNFSVIIPTAGLGSRMKQYTEFLNKALLPYQNKPIISYIIDQFPQDTKFIIPVGYKQQQIIDFCALAYPEKNIEFIHIPNYTESFTGPGYTIKHCLDSIDNSFYYIPCDTYFDEILPSFEEDTYFIKKVNSQNHYHYTTFKVVNDSITDIQFKINTDGSYYAFTGVMFIKNINEFKNRLLNCTSPEIIYTIEKNSKISLLNSWQDFGNIDNYKNVCNNGNYDFSKPDEITYFCNNKVLKYWNDNSIAQKKYNRTLNIKEIYPNNVICRNNWLSYEFFSGTTLYNNYSEQIFKNMLEWLENKVWIKSDVDIKDACNSFYKDKTLQRVKKYLDSRNNRTVNYINDKPVKEYDYYLNKIDWDLLINENIPSNIHGDLHFDNTLIGDNTFKIIDWRHEFANSLNVGDLYYDFAKLYGGLIINYSQIKNNNFKIKYSNDRIFLEVPSINNLSNYTKILDSYIKNNNYNLHKVKLLIPIIFWNMSPLHNDPFNDFLWYLGILLFEELEHV